MVIDESPPLPKANQGILVSLPEDTDEEDKSTPMSIGPAQITPFTFTKVTWQSLFHVPNCHELTMTPV